MGEYLDNSATGDLEHLLDKLRETLSRYASEQRWGEVSCIVVFRNGECHEMQVAEKETYRPQIPKA
jgi:hypothetical protein